MKKIYTLIFSLLLLFIFSETTKAQSCNDCRYVSQIFDSVTMETVQFGRGTRANGDTQQLYMDIYQPYGDTLSSRPVAVFAFGGAFVTGSRDDWYVQLVCNHLAKAGYVVASIDYRIYDDITEMITEIFGAFNPPQQMRIFFRPMQDMRGAIQYLKADYSELGNNYRIDTSKILIGGASSGAITSLMTAYCDKDSEMAEMGYGSLTPLNALGGFYSTSGFYPNYNWNVAGTFNVSGAIFNANWIEPGDVPVICAHGDADQVVAYRKGGFAGVTAGIFEMEGSYLVDSVARTKGVCSYLYTMEGRDHPSEDMGIEYFNSVVYRMALRMKAVVDDKSFCCGLNVDVTPGDTLYYDATQQAPAATLTAVVTGDNGNSSLQWCTMSCQATSNTGTITVTPDTTLKYVAAMATEGNCLSPDLYMVYDSTGIWSAINNMKPEAAGFSISPQPANQFISIAFDKPLSAEETPRAELYDIAGRRILQTTLVRHAQSSTIDVSKIPAGTYLLMVTVGEKQTAQPVIIGR